MGVGVRKDTACPRSSTRLGQRQLVRVELAGHAEAHEHRLGGAAAAERVRRALGDHAAAGDHDHAIGETLRLLHVVRGQQDRLAERAQPCDQLPRLAARGRVEAGGRLVQEQQLRVAAEAEREVEPPPLAAGERLDARAGDRAEADEVEHLVRRKRARVGGAVELDRLAGAELGVDGALLQDDADALAERALAATGIEAEHPHLAGVGAAMALEDLDQRGLAGAVGAEHGEHLAAAHGEVEAVERLHPAVIGLAHAADLDGGLRGARGSRGRGDFERVRDHVLQCRTQSADPSSADGSNLGLHPWVETARRGSTLAAMTRTGARPTVSRVGLRSYIRGEPPLSLFGTVAMTVIVLVALFTDPRPGLHGDGPLVALAVVALVAGILLSVPRADIPARRRVTGLALVAAGTWALTALQPVGAVFGALFYVVVISAMRLELIPALIVSVVAVAGECVVIGLTADDPTGGIIGTAFSVIPWFLVARLLRRLFQGRAEAEELVEELRESRAAHAESAALAERGRVARDMHDVLAHSLSALALQLEGARLLAQDRGSDPEVVAVDRARAPPRRRGPGRGARRDRRAARRRAARARAPAAARGHASPATAA